MTHHHTILIDCPDEKGLVYKISHLLYTHNLNIEKNDEFVETTSQRFFMRTELSGELPQDLLEQLRALLPANSKIQLAKKHKKRVVLFATKEMHCLGDLLIRFDSGELDAEMVAVVANHEGIGSLVKKFDIPFYCISAEGIDRPEHERRVLQLLDTLEPELLVLAKYMRILSSEFVSNYQNRILNIHHSFLPAFVGANPYKQAYERGVKIIGATAHFVNDNLDEGPIIAQGVVPIDHTLDWEQMRNLGRDVEKVVLSKALNLVLEDRVFVHGNKTVIL